MPMSDGFDIGDDTYKALSGLIWAVTPKAVMDQ